VHLLGNELATGEPRRRISKLHLGKGESGAVAVGFLSHRGLSCFFVTEDQNGIEPARWSERSDGHFCGFRVPPAEIYAPPYSISFAFGPDTIAWGLPYWLMTALWGVVYVRGARLTRFRIADVFAVMTVVAITIGLIQCRIALLGAVPLNLLTAALVATLALRGVRSLFTERIDLFPRWLIRKSVPLGPAGNS
jgi:hypothetical protein